METRNIIAAISLSAAVIILYTLFFAPPPVTQENLAEKSKTEQNSDTPSLEQKENVVDTLDIARNKFPGSGNSLDALCKRFRVDNSRRVKHTAILDCELLSKVYINLLDQKEPIFEFKDDLTEIEKKLSIPNAYSKKIIKLSKDEIENHKSFLKTNLKKNFF